jgi:uncharacterized DUF497 family protein
VSPNIELSLTHIFLFRREGIPSWEKRDKGRFFNIPTTSPLKSPGPPLPKGDLWVRDRCYIGGCLCNFLDLRIIVLPDPTHSVTENRYIALGKTKVGRLLFVVFTQRGKKIRVISARNMSRKERQNYNEKIK